jgi:hypothetical protein
MGTLAIGIAVNIGLSLLINEFFGPDDIVQEGPRVSNLAVAPSTYSRFVDISWGTDRHAGNLIDATDPALEEVPSSEKQGGGLLSKGGGPSVESISYTYFHTGRWSFGLSGAKSIIKLYFNRKLIYDATGTGNLARAGVEFTFYPGGADQLKDPDEVTQRGSANAQGYRHLSTLVFHRLPLASLGNAISSCEAIVAYEDTSLQPFEFMALPTSVGIPSGGDDDFMGIDPSRDAVFAMSNTGSTNWTGNLSDFTFRAEISAPGSFAQPVFGIDGFFYAQSDGSNNSIPVRQIDIDTGERTAFFGTTGIDTSDDDNTVGNSGEWGFLQSFFPGLEPVNTVVHLNTLGFNGSVFTVKKGSFVRESGLGTAQGLLDTEFTRFAGDHDRQRGYFFTPGTGSGIRVVMMLTEVSIGLLGAQVVRSYSTLRDFTAGAGMDFPTTRQAQGWAIDRSNGNLLISNGDGMVLYNPVTDTILASRSDLGFRGRFNYYSGQIFAFNDDGGNIVNIISTTTLETLSSFDLDSLSWPSGTGAIHPASMVWDDARSAIIFSRTGGAADEQITRVFVNRLQGEGVVISTLLTQLFTEYQGIELGGLDVADFDVSAFTGDIIPGFTLNREGDLRSAVDIVRRHQMADFIEEDWIIKGVKRGGAVEATIPADRIGQRSFDPNKPHVQRESVRAEELPMRMAFRYRNKDLDYAIDVDSDKRMRLPDPTVVTRQEFIEMLSIAETSTVMKQLAARWLWTMWNEAGRLTTRLPHEFLRLSPTDVIELNVFGETIRARLANLTWGAGWFLDIMAVEEDVRDYVSTIIGGPGSGFIPPFIPDGLDTGLILLDAPLLSLSDLNNDTHSNAYITFRAFGGAWPGATAYRSPDGVDFTVVANSNSEAAIAKVRTAPGAWARSNDGSFREIFQEIAEGGTMDITPLRREDDFDSATEEQVANGANTLGIITDSGVEVLQYQDATINADDDDVTLDRLLRGRLGTEDITDLAAINPGDFIILLEAGPVTRQIMAINDLNQSLVYRGVTVGQILEDARPFTGIYTGRDSRPLSVVDTKFTVTGSGGDVTWVRRGRDVKSSLSIPTPLNETQELYRVRLKNTLGAVVLTKEVTTPIVSLTTAEIALAGQESTAEVVQVSGTTLESPITPASITVVKDNSPLLIDSGDNSLTGGVPVTTFQIDSLDVPEGTVLVAGLFMAKNDDVLPGTVVSTNGDFTLVSDRQHTSGLIDSGIYSSIWTRIATASEPASFEWTWDVTYMVHIGLMAWQGLDDADLLEAFGEAGSSNSPSVTLPSMDNLIVDSHIITGLCLTSRGTVNPTTQPAGYVQVSTGLFTEATSSGRFRWQFGFEKIKSLGATGTRFFSHSGASASSNPIAANHMLLNALP